MKPSDARDFAMVMAVLSEVYDQGKPPSKIKIDIYFKALTDFSIEEIKSGVTAMIKERVYPSFPKPAEIIENIQGGKGDQSIVAWIKTVETIRKVGPYASVKFDDPVIHAVLTFMGGWVETGNWLEDELKWKQKEFERLYPIMQKRGSNPEYLVGITESTNGREDRNPIVMIGHQKRIEIEGGQNETRPENRPGRI